MSIEQLLSREFLRVVEEAAIAGVEGDQDRVGKARVDGGDLGADALDRCELEL
jgi:hypothetical protein